MYIHFSTKKKIYRKYLKHTQNSEDNKAGSQIVQQELKGVPSKSTFEDKTVIFSVDQLSGKYR